VSGRTARAARQAALDGLDPRGPGTGAVLVAYIHDEDVSHSWHMSLMEMVAHDLGNAGRVMSGGWIAVRYGTDGLAEARNKVVRSFLDERDAEWMLWLDTDMGFNADVVDRLIESADPVERPIVGALAFSWKEIGADGMGGYRCAPRPVILDWQTKGAESGFLGRASYPVNSLVQCSAVGSALVLIHRSVFVKIRDRYGDHWYDRIPNPSTGGNLIGEDLSFCMRAAAVQLPVFVNTAVRTSHHKSLWVGELDYWSAVVAPPATERATALVVTDSTEAAEPFMVSLRASTGLVDVVAVVADEETEQAWAKVGARTFLAPEGTPGWRFNQGLVETLHDPAPWILVVKDDVRLHPGWLDHCQYVAEIRDTPVVGLLDPANYASVAMEQASTLLVRRSYIDETGAGWDGPGVLAHEGYQGWPVDEIVLAARYRGMFAGALGAVAEHEGARVEVLASDAALVVERFAAEREERPPGHRVHNVQGEAAPIP